MLPEQEMDLVQLLPDHRSCGSGYRMSATEMAQGALGQTVPLLGINQGSALLTCGPRAYNVGRSALEDRLILPVKIFAVVELDDGLGCAEITVIAANRNDMKSAQA